MYTPLLPNVEMMKIERVHAIRTMNAVDDVKAVTISRGLRH